MGSRTEAKSPWVGRGVAGCMACSVAGRDLSGVVSVVVGMAIWYECGGADTGVPC